MESRLIRKTVNNNGIEIEYYVYNQVNPNATLILSLGVWEPAARAFPLITRLGNRHCIVLSYRGRGNSETPVSGFDWKHHSSDLRAVLQNELYNNPVFLGFSKGVSYMLGYLSFNPEKPKGVIIVDYPAIHGNAEKGYAQFWRTLKYNGYKLENYITKETLKGIEEESSYKEFYLELNQLKCPVWVFRGIHAASAIPSNLNASDIEKYLSTINKLEIVDFSYSGHMILDEELGKACVHVNRILSSVDANQK